MKVSVLMKARLFAAAGPRVAAVLLHQGKYKPVPGYIDEDQEDLKQLVLVTPDGRLWVPMSEKAVMEVNK